jgi:hypothetical protein
MHALADQRVLLAARGISWSVRGQRQHDRSGRAIWHRRDRCRLNRPLRGPLCSPRFFADTAIYRNIVANPPFSRAQEAIEHGLQHVPVGGRVAVLADVNFLSAQKRYALHTRPEFERLLVLMRRPS